MASASMADKIIVLDGDDEEESPQPSCSTSSFQPQAKQSVPTQSPFASAKKEAHVLQAENSRLFTEVSFWIRLKIDVVVQSVR